MRGALGSRILKLLVKTWEEVLEMEEATAGTWWGEVRITFWHFFS
jgi:hypothetical protein